VGTRTSWIVLLGVLLATTWLRFTDLGRSAARTDEINFLMQAARGQSLLDLWTNPPWLNQIPFADSIAIAWSRLRPGGPDERSLREPFALLGCLTVAGSVVWLVRRRGLSAGILLGLWLGLLPFHVDQSREAYYYVLAMACAAGLTLHTVDMLARLRDGQSLSIATYAAWTGWAALTCLSHMGTWAVTAMCWLMLLWAGVWGIPAPRRTRHLTAMSWVAVLTGIFMFRWVWRAFAELQRVSQADGHIGGAFAWVAPRVLPFFTAGANVFGILASLLLLGAGVRLFVLRMRRPRDERDCVYEALTMVTAAGFIAAYAYVAAVGGGVAKVTYFSAVLPVFLVWAAYTLDLVAAGLPGRGPAVMRLSLPCLIAGVLALPAWMTTRLEGRPVPYKRIRDWLDANLDPGSVVLIDRWFEPWNEMAVYAPKNVTVTFSVPDEPYETYRQLRWRDVTEDMIEQGRAQGFIRLVRKYESQDGLWTWPETYFAHREVITNDVFIWLRDRGYVTDDSAYTSNPGRLVIEIFYDLREDIVARRRAAGDRFAVFFDKTMRFEKTGPMGIFRVQTQQFMDWRVLEKSGIVDVYNLTDTARRARIRVRGVSPAGVKAVVGAGIHRFEFGGGQLQEWVLGPVNLETGLNAVSFTDPGWERNSRPLFIQSVDVLPEPETDESP
jgi:hypothetical protein